MDLDLRDVTLRDVQVILRVMRAERDRIVGTRNTMVARIEAIRDGEKAMMEAEITLATSEIHLLSSIIAKLWAILSGRG
jgi:hypothetical protein